MHEKVNRSMNTYPVTVKLVEIGWILQEPEVGIVFLTRMCEQENLELFSVESVQMIIEFLYQEVKWFVLKQRLWVHILQFTVFIASISFIQSCDYIEIDKRKARTPLVERAFEVAMKAADASYSSGQEPL